MQATNSTLILRGEWYGAPNDAGGGGVQLSSKYEYCIDHLTQLQNNLLSVDQFWRNRPSIGGVLLSLHYKTLVAKSNRATELLHVKGHLQKAVRGARFELNPETKQPENHVITYFILKTELNESIKRLGAVFEWLKVQGETKVKQTILTKIKEKKIKIGDISSSCIQKILKDAAYVDTIEVDRFDLLNTETPVLMSFYRTGVGLDRMLRDIGITLMPDDYLDANTVRLLPKDKEKVFSKASYLISMALSDLATMPELNEEDEPGFKLDDLPPPKGNEPWVGVIDTLFCPRSYFASWVDIHNEIPNGYTPTKADYAHGTAVCSILVDGESKNIRLTDGCGRFRVRHFGIAVAGENSRFDLMRRIRDIVKSNPDIRVWNLSLGADEETGANCISPEAAFLDQLQTECNVTFVVAATNDRASESGRLSKKRIGSPADTVNGLVVGACDSAGKPTDYTRHGPVLHFFVKPDVLYFGGQASDPVNVWVGKNGGGKYGTSFAAPWITRKLAYLIEVLKLSRETAKALLIDSAVGWDSYPNSHWTHTGYGVVPAHIDSILQTPSDEIRFILHTTTKNYKTYNYLIPIPQNKDEKFNFSARATVCYFPDCRRDQGVDYTTTELDVRFGRVVINEGKTNIKDIRIPTTKDERFSYLKEKELRTMFQKWSNVKVFKDEIKQPRKGSSPYTPYWGVSADMIDRLGTYSQRGLAFTVVVTLREESGKNEIHRFTQLCQAKGWMVEELNVQQRLKANALATHHVILQ